MGQTKKCSGCKKEKSLDNFYKNKLVLDGHSNYCVNCTKENSKKYFKRKKERDLERKNDNLLKMTLLTGLNTEDKTNAENLMKVLMIEKMLKSLNEEVQNLKSNLIQTKETDTLVSDFV